MIKLPPPGRVLSSTICTNLHSMFTCDSLTRGGRTRSLGTGVNPETANSSTPLGYSPDVRFILSAISSLTIFTTNSPVAFTLRYVSFRGSRKDVEKQTIGGSPLITLRKLDGARLRTPSRQTRDTKPIGRRTTE